MDSKLLMEKIVEILDDKKARDIDVIEIKDISSLADYFIICSGGSTTHNKSIADSLGEKLLEFGVRHSGKEGYHTARWILVDFKDVVLHVFHQEDRQFYNLERLWSDGKLVEQH